MDLNVITTDGKFDARKARQLLYEWTRENQVVGRSFDLARHLGLSGEETYLLMAVHLLSANEGWQQRAMEEVNTKIPTFRVQATQGGPFVTEKKGWGGLG